MPPSIYLNDTLVFVATPRRLLADVCVEESLWGRIRLRSLPTISRNLLSLRVTLLSNLVAILPPIPTEIKAQFITPYAVIVNVAASKVYRDVKAGFIDPWLPSLPYADDLNIVFGRTVTSARTSTLPVRPGLMRYSALGFAFVGRRGLSRDDGSLY